MIGLSSFDTVGDGEPGSGMGFVDVVEPAESKSMLPGAGSWWKYVCGTRKVASIDIDHNHKARTPAPTIARTRK